MKKFQLIVNILVLIAMVGCVVYGYICYYSVPWYLHSAPAWINLYYSIPFLAFLAIFNGAFLYWRNKEKIKHWRENSNFDTNFPGVPPTENKTIL